MHTAIPSALPDLTGRVALVTGATSGIGLVTAELLGAAGAETVLAVRDETRGRRVANHMRSRNPDAAFRVEELDLADLRSVRACAERIVDQGRPLDLLVNNAGVMGDKHRQTTADGFELMFGTNFLGPFALTGLLLPALQRSYAPRVVSVGSLAAWRGRLDPAQQARFSPMGAYAYSKLALTAFGRELQRRSDAYGWGLTSVIAHPGWSATNLGGGGFGKYARVMPAMTQPEDGALPVVVAATRLEVPGGACVGPTKRFQLLGRPGIVPMPKQANDSAKAAQLWAAAEEMTGVRFPTS
ncbi:SDR family NAD(P)-dependent oxidoreductase [Mariniluteicoccus flavus]